MSFDLTDTSKKTLDTIQYNYDNKIHLGHPLKTLLNDGYIKHEYSQSVSSGFSNPNLIVSDNQCVSQTMSLFKRHYSVMQSPHDGILVVENKSISTDEKYTVNQSTMFAVFLLKTSSNINPTPLDDLFSVSSLPKTLDLNSMILDKKQPCILFDNVVLFSTPILIRSSFAKFITPEYVSFGLLNSFTPDYRIAIASATQLPLSAMPMGADKPSTATATESPLREGLTSFAKKINTMEDSKFENEMSCNASDEITNENISQIAMVPVDSDFLTGVYQISMMRTLFDVFIFIMILIFCFVVSPVIYSKLFIYYVSKYDKNDENKQYTLLTYISYWFAIILIVGIGLPLAIDGIKTKNASEMMIGMYFTIIVVFSILSIYYKFVNDKVFLQGIGTGENFDLFKFLKFLKHIYIEDKHNIIFFTTLAILFLTVLVCYFVYTFNQKSTQRITWGLFLWLPFPVTAIIVYYIVALEKLSSSST